MLDLIRRGTLLHIFLASVYLRVTWCRTVQDQVNGPTTPKMELPAYCHTPGAPLVNPECGKGSTQSSGSSSPGASTKPSVPVDATPGPESTTKQETQSTTSSNPEVTVGFNGAPVVNYFGVSFSPYVVKGAQFNSYSLGDIKRMMEIVLTNHKTVSTYGMGVASYNKDNAWDETDGNCLIARAAAIVNKEKSFYLSIVQGIYQQDSQELQDQEIENAFSAAADANEIYSGTVWGLIFTNSYIDKCDDCGQRVLDMMKTHKARAFDMHLRVGTRINICEQINGGPYQKIIEDIVEQSHFIMCSFFPPANSSNVDTAIAAISNAYFSAADGIWEVNPNIEVFIGETGWASEGQTYNPPEFNSIEKEKEFWLKMKNWAAKNRVKVQMFEAFDEPWKPDPDGERNYGWWFRNGTKYIEKTTGKEY